MAKVELRAITKRYDREILAVDDLSLVVEEGEFFTLLGPSGSGKTTLLRIISGLESPDTGDVAIGRANVNRLPPRARDVAMVFQAPALYPYLSVYENLAFSLRTQNVSNQEVQVRVRRAASPLGLVDVLERKPQALSGGQRQRVALGRAMVRRPSVYLLDEPFSSLDAPLRSTLRADLMALHVASQSTMILVTHDQAEAMALSDRIGLMDQGKLVQVGTPRELYEHPSNRFVAGFLGDPSMNFLPCRVVETSPLKLTFNGMTAPGIEIADSKGFHVENDMEVDLGLRPEDILLSFDGEPAPEGRVGFPAEGKVTRVEYLGNSRLVTFLVGTTELRARLESQRSLPSRGDRCRASFETSKAHWFDHEGGDRLEASIANGIGPIKS